MKPPFEQFEVYRLEPRGHFHVIVQPLIEDATDIQSKTFIKDAIREKLERERSRKEGLDLK